MKRNELVIVTGASKGLGRIIAEKLYNAGYKIAVFARNKELLDNFAGEINDPENFMTSAGDVTDQQFVNDSVSKIISVHGGVDHLINNAGLAIFKKFVDSSPEEFKAQMDVNMFGIYNLTKAVVPGMIEKRKGTILNISSISGKNGFVNGTMYSATKHAVMGFTRSLMLELREYNIKVGSICPGSISTDMLSGTPLEPAKREKILDGGEIADLIKTILELPAKAMVSEIEIRPVNPK